MKKSTLAVIAVALVIVALLAGRFYLSQQDFGLSNPYWNGLLHLGDGARPLYSVSALSGLGANATLLVISPQVNYTAAESSDLSSFMERGGQIIVMDDYGYANSLLYSIGSPILIDRVPLCQDGDFYRRPSFPIINNIEPSSLTANVSTLVLDHPVSLNITGNASIIASTSRLGWLDYDDNGLLDKDEPTGSYPVAATVSYGNGRLTVISDPDLLINSMQDKGDNQVLASNILASGIVYADASHGQSIPPLAQAYYTIKYDMAAQLLCVFIILLLAYLFNRRSDIMTLIKRPSEKPVEPQDVKAAIIESMKKTPLKKEQIEELKRKL
jgi:hypothetical protein